VRRRDRARPRARAPAYWRCSVRSVFGSSAADALSELPTPPAARRSRGRAVVPPRQVDGAGRPARSRQ
jgi:hypothetical protein